MSEEKIINDLKKLGIEVVKSPMGYYGIKTKKYNKEELVMETQRMIINSDFSIVSAKKIGDFIKKNIQTNSEWFKEMKKSGKDTFNYFEDMVGKEGVKKFHNKLKAKLDAKEEKEE